MSMRTVIVLSRASLVTTPVRTLRRATEAWGVSAILGPLRQLALARQGEQLGDLAPALAKLAGALERARGVLEAQVEQRLARLAQPHLELAVVQLADLRGL